jgi:hypothetical protein
VQLSCVAADGAATLACNMWDAFRYFICLFYDVWTENVLHNIYISLYDILYIWYVIYNVFWIYCCPLLDINWSLIWIYLFQTILQYTHQVITTMPCMANVRCFPGLYIYIYL